MSKMSFGPGRIHVFFSRPSALLRLLLFIALMLVVRGAPALLLYRKVLPHVERVPLALLSATGLPLIVVITTIGASEGRILPENAAALVGAGLGVGACLSGCRTTDVALG
jgi:hypothetical protein